MRRNSNAVLKRVFGLQDDVAADLMHPLVMPTLCEVPGKSLAA